MASHASQGKFDDPSPALNAAPVNAAPGRTAALDAVNVLTYILGGLFGLLAALFFVLPGLAGGETERSLLERLQMQLSPNTSAMIVGFVTAGVALADVARNRQRTREQQAELENLQDSDHAKTELISTMTHQMRTPLTAVKYALKMYLGGDFGPVNNEQRGILRNVYGSTETLVTMTQDFLNASKLDAGRLQVTLKPTRVADFERSLAATVDRLKPIADGKRIKLGYAAQLNPALRLRADLAKLAQVVENLVENAINYTLPGGSVTVTANGDSRRITVSIADTGIGIPPAEQSKIFTKFFRASNAQATSSTGTGIGLFISKKFIEAHQGSLTFAATPNRGTTFRFTVPLQPVSDAEQFFIHI